MNFNIYGIVIGLVAVIAIVDSNPIKPEENSKDIEPGVMENLEGMYKNYDDIDDGDEYDFELDGANSHGLGYYTLESEPFYMPSKKDGLFDKFPKFDLFGKFHKVDKFEQYDNTGHIQPVYEDGHYQQHYDVVAVPIKLKKCGFFGCKFHKSEQF